ncbi:MAG TPA: hypothetical protein VLL04_03260 [Rhizomicrobium sp.]|nr:hypothetical protein [Rhizomicrobium sp.]
MKKTIAAILCFCFSGAQAMEAGPWVTFKTGHNSQGKLEHQIDSSSIKQEGRFKSFWTRIWVVREKQPLAFSVNERLYFWSQKFLVDCGGRRFGADFVDTVQPREEKRRATEKTMHWAALDKFPAVAKTVCGAK